ncbi:MAG TPA: luciferase family protein [Thermoplasmata archaeon]|nr:luciferase family protein [Thermoplasmata archaeon]
MREELEGQLRQLEGLTRRASRHGDSYSYFVADLEIVHFHGDERMDIRLTRERIRFHKSEAPFDPRVTTRGPSANWIAVRLRETGDIALALELVDEAIRANS